MDFESFWLLLFGINVASIHIMENWAVSLAMGNISTESLNRSGVTEYFKRWTNNNDSLSIFQFYESV